MHQKHQNRTTKTTISQQYISFVFPFAETRSVDVTSVDRENNLVYERYAIDKYLIRLFMDKMKRSCWRLSNKHSVCDVELLRLSTSPTSATVVVEPTTNRAHSSSPDETLLYNYALPSTPPCRWLRCSVNPSSSTLCRWPHGSDHVQPSSTHPWRHCLLTPRRDPSLRPLRVYTCLPSTTTILCRHRELAMPPGYAAYF